MLEFPYLPERVRGSAPPSLPAGTRYFWRPLVPVKIACSSGMMVHLHRALIDTGSLETVFPLSTASVAGIAFVPDTKHVLRWRGLPYPLRFGITELQLESAGNICRWVALVGFSPAPLRYPILGSTGFQEFFDVTFRGDTRAVELVPNASFPGTISLSP